MLPNELQQEYLLTIWDLIPVSQTRINEIKAVVDVHTDTIATNTEDLLAQALAIATKLNGTPLLSGAVRALDDPFQIDPDWPALVIYTIELSETAPLLSSQNSRVELHHDQNNPPATADGEVYLSGSQLAGLSLVSLQSGDRKLLMAWIPPGDYVELVTSGSGTKSLVNSTELIFNG